MSGDSGPDDTDAELEQRVKRLEATIEKMMPNRRDVLKGTGMAALGAAGMYSYTGGAQAQTQAAGQIGTENNPVDVEAATVNAHELYNDDRSPDIVVRKDGSDAIAVDESGTIDSGSDHTAVIQSALDSLTDGRSWKEIVSVKGDFSVSSVEVPGYTILDLSGARLQSDGSTNSIVTNDGDGQENITIRGGIIDHDADSGDDTGFCISMGGVTDLDLVGVTAINAKRDAFVVGTDSSGNECQDVVMRGCRAINANADGFNPLNATDIAIDSCIARDCGQDNFHVSNNVEDCTVTGCISENAGGDAMELRGQGGYTVTGCVLKGAGEAGIRADNNDYEHITIGNTVVKDCGSYGISVIGGSSTDLVTISNNTVQNCSGWGINIGGVDGATVDGNTVKSISDDGTHGDGINVSAVNCRIMGNWVRDTAQSDIRNVNDDCWFEANDYEDDSIENGGVRMVENGLGTNAGDPSSTGQWNGEGIEGLIVRDTSNSDSYLYNDGTWSQIAST